MKTSYNLFLALSKLGLNASEQRVYTVGLDCGELSSQELINLTRMPKPTVMTALKSLRTIGLCQVQQRDGRSLIYLMQPPAAAQTYIGGQVRKLDNLSQTLESITADMSKPETWVVKQAKTQAEVQDLLESALRCKSKKWRIIAPKDNALTYMPKSYVEYFKNTRRKQAIESQTLWDEQWKGQKISLNDILMRKPRYVPKSLANQIPCLLLAFDDKLLAIEGTTEPTAVMIQNQAVTDTFALVFELAWRSLKG